MIDGLPDPLVCPHCGVLLRDGPDALVCPECGHRELYPNIDYPGDGGIPGIRGG